MSVQLFLYTGPEFGERNDAVNSAKESFKKKCGQIDEHSFYLSETPFSQVMTILQSGTLFSNGVCVVCRNAELLKKKEDIQMIQDWVQTENDSSMLILVSDEISVDTKLTKLVPPSNKKQFWEMFDSKKVPWIMSFFSKNGYRIEQDAAEMILDMVQNNTQDLKNECSRFFILFPKEHEITIKDVESVIADSREETAFTLFKQIADSSLNVQKRFENGITILQKLKLSKENSSVMIIAGLASCFRKVVLWHEISVNGYEPDEDTCRENGFASKLLRSQYRSAAKIWTKGQATGILAVLSSTDMEIRENGTLLENVILQKMLYEIIVKKGAQIQSVESDF